MLKRTIFMLTLMLMTYFNFAAAHTMPITETRLGGIDTTCSLGYVKQVYGEPREKNYFDGVFIHGVTYVYSDYFSVTARVTGESQIAEDDWLVVGYKFTNDALSTPSGFTVGTPYEEVIFKYGYGVEFNNDGRKGHAFTWSDSAVELDFFVDDNSIITEIYLGTEF